MKTDDKLQMVKEHILEERGKEIEWMKDIDTGSYKIRITAGGILCELPEEWLDDNDLEPIIRSISNSIK